MKNLYKYKWAVALLGIFVAGSNLFATIVPAAPTYTSAEFETIQSEMADIVLALAWGVTAVIAVIAVTMIFRLGRKVLKKLNP